jgi:hypothetical protein
METWRNGDIEKWRHVHGDIDMETWTWRHGQGDMDMETWTWRQNQTENREPKPRRCSLIHLPFAYRAHGCLPFVHCLSLCLQTDLTDLLIYRSMFMSMLMPQWQSQYPCPFPGPCSFMFMQYGHCSKTTLTGESRFHVHGVNTNKCESSYNSRHFDFRSLLLKQKMKLNIL